MGGSGYSYLIKQGLHNLRANKLMSFASIGVLCACLLITGAAALLGANVNSFADYLGAQNELVVFLADDLSDEDITQIESTIAAHGNIAGYEYISKEEALKEEMAYLGEYGELLAGYTGENNPLPASFRVTVEDLAAITSTVSFLETISGVYYVKTTTELITVLLNIKKVVNYVSWGIVIALSAVSLVVISNTIRLTVFARRKEINIMKFVGATNGFIRLPFLVEGIAIGILAAVFSFAILLSGYWAVLTYFAPNIGGLFAGAGSVVLPVEKVALPLAGAFFASGVVVGGLGSAASIRKHLQV